MKVQIVDNNQGSGDWKGIYLNGTLAAEGHSLDLLDTLGRIKDSGEPIETLGALSMRDDQMEILGHLPKSVDDMWEFERATSAGIKPVAIVFNGTEKTIDSPVLYYGEAARLAGYDYDKILSVVVHEKGKEGRTLSPQSFVIVSDGARVSAYDTSGA